MTPPTQENRNNTGLVPVKLPGEARCIIFLSPEKRAALPPEVRDCLLDEEFARGGHEQDIVIALLGTETPWRRDLAILAADSQERYRPALPHLLELQPGYGCWACGGEENTVDSCCLGPDRWLCRKCFRQTSMDNLESMFRIAMRAAWVETDGKPSHSKETVPAGQPAGER